MSAEDRGPPNSYFVSIEEARTKGGEPHRSSMYLDGYCFADVLRQFKTNTNPNGRHEPGDEMAIRIKLAGKRQ